jgi:hypothetical protein
MLVAFGLMGLLVFRQWPSVVRYNWQFQSGWLMVSALTVCAAWFVEIRLWQSALALVGGTLELPTAISIWFSSSIVRYVPGNIWQPLSLTVRCQARQIPPEVTLASVLLFHGVQLLAVAAIAAFALAAGAPVGLGLVNTGTPSAWWAAVFAVPLIAVLTWPRPLFALANRVLVRVGRPPLPARVTSGGLIQLFGISAVSWVLASAGFVALVYGLTRPVGEPFWPLALYLASAYPIAYAGGFLSLLTPSGLGVREGLLYILLVPVLGAGGAIGVALAMGGRAGDVSERERARASTHPAGPKVVSGPGLARRAAAVPQ